MKAPYDRVKDLQVMFANAVLRKQISRNSPQDNRVYDLGELLDPAFTLNASPELGIANVELRKLRVQVVGKNDHAVRIDLGTETPARVLHERLEAAMRDIPRSMRKVSLVGIRITFELRPGDRPRREVSRWPGRTPAHCRMIVTASSSSVCWWTMVLRRGRQTRTKKMQ